MSYHRRCLYNVNLVALCLIGCFSFTCTASDAVYPGGGIPQHSWGNMAPQQARPTGTLRGVKEGSTSKAPSISGMGSEAGYLYGNASQRVVGSGLKPSLGRTATGFVYDALSPMRYEQLKLAWFNQHSGETPTPGDMENLAYASFLTQHSETPLWKEITHWRMVGGPHPWYVVPRIQLENPPGNEAQLGLSLKVKIQGVFGVWYPENKGAITDVKLLQHRPEQHVITEYNLPVEGLATGDSLLKELKPIALMPILKSRPDRFLNQLMVDVTLMQEGKPVDAHSIRLKLYPDVFALPIYLY